MEPLTSGTIAIATLILNKALEKSGEKLGEAVSQQVSKLGQLIRQKPLPKTVAIEQADQLVDFGQVVLEVETIADTDTELAQTLDELAAIVKANPKLMEAISAYVIALRQSQPTTVQNFGKLAENVQEIKGVFQGNTISQSTFNF